MTYVDPAAAARAYQSMPPPLAVAASPDGGRVGAAVTYKLPVRGQGTIGFVLATSAPFTVTALGPPGAPALRWSVDPYGANLAVVSLDGEEKVWLAVPGVASSLARLSLWFQLRLPHRLMRYGKAIRLGTMLASCQLDRPAEWGARSLGLDFRNRGRRDRRGRRGFVDL